MSLDMIPRYNCWHSFAWCSLNFLNILLDVCHSFQNNLSHYYFKYFFFSILFFSHFTAILTKHMLHLLKCAPQFLDILFCFSLLTFLFVFQVGHFYLYTFKLADSFPQLYWVYWYTHWRHSVLQYVLFVAFLLDSESFHPSAYIIHLFLLHTFPSTALNIPVIVILNFLIILIPMSWVWFWDLFSLLRVCIFSSPSRIICNIFIESWSFYIE